MIFGWLEYGRTDRWVLVDPVFPWPAIHNGRNAMREWADLQQKARYLMHTPGPRRCPWPCKVAAAQAEAAAELRIWPCAIHGKPRRWGPKDKVWRPAITELSEHVAADIKCPVHVLWMGNDGEIERAVSPPGLQGRGFLCWGKGEREPKADHLQRLFEGAMTGATKIQTQDLGITVDKGDDAWL